MQNIRKQHGRITLDAYSLRSFGANGFGDAAIGRTEPHSLLDSIELYHQAREQRSYWLRRIIGAALQATADRLRQMLANWTRRQHARATYSALRGLDAHILRDLGLHRSELMSVAAEVAGSAESTRVRLVLANRSRPF